ncbi:MAG: thioredoxin domain-containing protein [Acidimicrobiales bacterium]
MPAVDVTDATFEQDVVEASASVPVVVDLWAPWCGPCRSLGPVIERVVEETNGAVTLAKVNIDENPRVQATFRVQSIPAVFALYERKIVDQFIGALPEQAVREFVGRLAKPPSEVDKLVEAGDEESLRAALELEPAHEGAISALASMLAARGDTEEALALVERIPETPETRRIAATARLNSETIEVAPGMEPAEDGVVNVAGGDLEGRISSLLDRLPGDDDARQEIVDLLETMDADDPRRSSWRRALASKLY